MDLRALQSKPGEGNCEVDVANIDVQPKGPCTWHHTSGLAHEHSKVGRERVNTWIMDRQSNYDTLVTQDFIMVMPRKGDTPTEIVQFLHTPISLIFVFPPRPHCKLYWNLSYLYLLPQSSYGCPRTQCCLTPFHYHKFAVLNDESLTGTCDLHNPHKANKQQRIRHLIVKDMSALSKEAFSLLVGKCSSHFFARISQFSRRAREQWKFEIDSWHEES